MNLTTQELIDRFQRLSTNEIPSLQQTIKEATLFLLKGLNKILLIYPVNIIILFIAIFWLVYAIIASFSNSTKNKRTIYWPNQHNEAHDQHVKNYKKDIRQIQNQSINLGRKMEARLAQPQSLEKTEGETNVNEDNSQIATNLKNLLQQREYIKDVSKELIGQIKMSQTQILSKLQKYSK